MEEGFIMDLISVFDFVAFGMLLYTVYITVLAIADTREQHNFSK